MCFVNLTIHYQHACSFNYEQKSIGVVGGLIMLVLGIVVSIYIIRFTIIESVGEVGAQVIASVANAIQIQVSTERKFDFYANFLWFSARSVVNAFTHSRKRIIFSYLLFCVRC